MAGSSHSGATLPPTGRLVMSGDIFGFTVGSGMGDQGYRSTPRSSQVRLPQRPDSTSLDKLRFKAE